MADISYWIWYVMATITNKRMAMELYLDMDKNPEKIYKLTEKELKDISYLKENDREALLNKDMDRVRRELLYAENYNVKIITAEDEDYPKRLKEIYDYPLILYIRGERFFKDDIFISVVGTRHPIEYSQRAAKSIAYNLSLQGVTVVSGMAKGIDTCAHRGALQAGARTVAVLGCGVNKVYPAENKELMLRILNSGAVISEYPFDTPPFPQNFPERNRIMSGLSLGTLIVEAAMDSGSLITAKLALEQGRDVFVVEGKQGDKRYEGSHLLIEEGAKKTTRAADILEEYRYIFGDIFKMKSFLKENVEFELHTKADSDIEEKILAVIADNHMYLDEIQAKTEIPLSELVKTLTMLELCNKVIHMPGGLYGRSHN